MDSPKDNAPTLRQKLLYKYLEGAIENGVTDYLNVTTIATALNSRLYAKDKYEVCYDKNRNWHNPCPAISSDVEAINSTLYFDKMVLVQDNKYRLAMNPSEADEKIEWCQKKIEYYSHLKSIYEFKKKQDGQGKTVNNADRPMTPNSKPMHDTYATPNS